MISRDSLAGLQSPYRLAALVVIGAVATVITGFVGGWSYAPLVGWDAGALVFILAVWFGISSMDASATAAHTNRDDPGRAASDIIVLVAAVASIDGVIVLFARPDGASTA